MGVPLHTKRVARNSDTSSIQFVMRPSSASACFASTWQKCSPNLVFQKIRFPFYAESKLMVTAASPSRS